MASELPFLNPTAEDIQALTPIGSQCTVLCEIEKIWAKPSKAGNVMIWFRFVCIDDNSPEKGRPSIKSLPLDHFSMFVPLLTAALRIEKGEIKAGAINLNELNGKQLLIKFDLLPTGQPDPAFSIQPSAYYRSDRPLVA